MKLLCKAFEFLKNSTKSSKRNYFRDYSFMPITITDKKHDHFDLCEWAIDSHNRSQVIMVLAHLYLRQEQNALRVINALPTKVRKRTQDVGPNVIEKLTAPKKVDLDLAQGDGTDVEKNGSPKSYKSFNIPPRWPPISTSIVDSRAKEASQRVYDAPTCQKCW